MTSCPTHSSVGPEVSDGSVDEQVALFPRVSENPIVHLMEQVHTVKQEAVKLQETVRDFS